MAAYTRAQLDALNDSMFNVASGGPVAKYAANDFHGFMLDYVDGGNSEYQAAIGSVPAVSGLTATINNYGPIIKLVFTFAAVAVTHTDAAGSGSSGSLKLFDFAPMSLLCIGSRSDLVFTGDTLIDGNQGDMAFVYGFGSAACNAGDGAITSTEVDIAAVSGTITLSSFTATSATLLKGAGSVIDGTSTAADLFFNESGSAATSEANGVLTITSGTAEFIFLTMGDD